MGSIIDITEHKRIAEQGRHQEERLQASARLITMGEMASSVAHELNQPLTAINPAWIGERIEKLIRALEREQQTARARHDEFALSGRLAQDVDRVLVWCRSRRGAVAVRACAGTSSRWR